MTLFWRKRAVSEDDLDVDGVGCEGILALAGDGERDREGDVMDSWRSRGLM